MAIPSRVMAPLSIPRAIAPLRDEPVALVLIHADTLHSIGQREMSLRWEVTSEWPNQDSIRPRKKNSREEHIQCEENLLSSPRTIGPSLYPGVSPGTSTASRPSGGKHRIAISLAAVALAAVLVLTLCVFAVTSKESLRHATPSDAAGWVLETVDNSANSGWFTSIAVDSNDYAHIAYCNYPPASDEDL